jgi:hypothetical protein
MSDYTTPEGNYTDLDENLAMQFSHSSIAAVPVNGNDDDRRRVMRPERRPATKLRSPERLMVSTRRSVAMNLDESEDKHFFVDDVDALTLELAKKSVQRTISIKIETIEQATGFVNHYTGQAGIVGANIVTANCNA